MDYKVFIFVGGESDWFVAESLESAIEQAAIDLDADSVDELKASVESGEMEVRELTREEVDELKFRDEEQKGSPTTSAREMIEDDLKRGQKLPYYIASTCF